MIIRKTIPYWLVVCFVTAAAPQLSAKQTEQQSYKVWLGERDIGRHIVAIEQQGDRTIAKTKVRYKVKVLFITVFNYIHDAQEVWQGNCLESIESTTKENKQASKLTGTQTNAGFELRRNAEPFIYTGNCIGTYPYWDMAKIRRNVLLNSQTGELAAAEVEDIGQQPVPKLDLSAQALRINTDDAVITVWYSPEGRWIALQSDVDGQPLVYVDEKLIN